MAVSAGRATNTLPAALLVAGLTTVLLAWSCVEYLKGIHEFGVKLWTPTSRKGKEESAAAFITIMREEYVGSTNHLNYSSVMIESSLGILHFWVDSMDAKGVVSHLPWGL